LWVGPGADYHPDMRRRLVTFVLVAGFTALATLSWLRDNDPSAVRTATSMAAASGRAADGDDPEWNAQQLAEEAGITEEAAEEHTP
jgi:hypothetical protein